MTNQPGELREIVARAQARAQQGRFTAAISLLEGLAATAETAPEVVYFEASLNMETQRWAVAERHLAELQKVLPGRAVIVFDRATCLIELNRLTDAFELLDDPSPEVQDRFPRFVLLARIAFALGDNETGEEWLHTALKHGRPALEMAAACPELRPALRSLVKAIGMTN